MAGCVDGGIGGGVCMMDGVCVRGGGRGGGEGYEERLNRVRCQFK